MTSVIVCGLHRSGTTYVGEMLKQTAGCVLRESLNERYGMKDVSISYSYAERFEDCYVSLIEEAVYMARLDQADCLLLIRRAAKTGISDFWRSKRLALVSFANTQAAPPR